MTIYRTEAFDSWIDQNGYRGTAKCYPLLVAWSAAFVKGNETKIPTIMQCGSYKEFDRVFNEKCLLAFNKWFSSISFDLYANDDLRSDLLKAWNEAFGIGYVTKQNEIEEESRAAREELYWRCNGGI